MHKVGQRICKYMLPLNQILLWFCCNTSFLYVCVMQPHNEEHTLQRGGSVSHRRAQSDCLQNRLPITQHFGKVRSVSEQSHIYLKYFLNWNRCHPHLSLSLPNLPVPLSYTASLCCFASFIAPFLSLSCDSPRHLSPLGECRVAVPLLCYSMSPNVSHVPVGLFTNLGLPEMRGT